MRISRTRRGRRKRWPQALGVLILELGCNALLDNESRMLDPNAFQAGQGGVGEASFAAAGDSGVGGVGGAGEGVSTGDSGADAGAGGEGGGGGEGGAAAAGEAGAALGGNLSNGGVAGASGGVAGANGGVAGARGGVAGAGAGTGGKNGGGGGSAGSSGAAPVCACDPGAKSQRTVDCVCGGGNTKSQTRTCSKDCKWGEWTDLTTCDCCNQVVYCNGHEAGLDVGSWCRSKDSRCSKAEVLNDCYEDLDTVCGARVEPFRIDY